MRIKITKEGTAHVVYDDEGREGKGETLEDAVHEYAIAYHEAQGPDA